MLRGLYLLPEPGGKFLKRSCIASCVFPLSDPPPETWSCAMPRQISSLVLGLVMLTTIAPIPYKASQEADARKLMVDESP
jgi:hypothetical protein